MTILHIDSSARTQNSVTRDLTGRIVAKLGGDVIRRDLAQGEPLLNQNWVEANATDLANRTDAQREALAISDTLVAELQDADTIVIGVPVYNFGIPAALKLWVDQIARARVTFHYTSDGPRGLLTGKRAIIAVASGGVPVDSPVDFATPYMRQIMNFIGISDITIVAADAMGADADKAMTKAVAQIDALAA